MEHNATVTAQGDKPTDPAEPVYDPAKDPETVLVPEGVTLSLWNEGPKKEFPKAYVDFRGVSLERLMELARRSIVIQWQGPFRLVKGTTVTPDHWPGPEDGLQPNGTLIIHAASLGTGRKAKDPVKAALNKAKRDEALKARDAEQVGAFAKRFQAMQAMGYPMAVALDLPSQLTWEANPVPYKAP